MKCPKNPWKPCIPANKQFYVGIVNPTTTDVQLNCFFITNYKYKHITFKGLANPSKGLRSKGVK